MTSYALAKSILLSSAIGAALLVVPAQKVAAQEPAEFRWSITPYVWAPTTKVDLSYQGTDIGGGQIRVKDVVDKIDAAFMLNVEYGKGNWSVFTDLLYMEASDRVVRQFLTVDSSFEQVMLDAAVSYWPGGVGSSLNLIAGVRYTSSDNRFSFSGNQNGTPLGTIRSDEGYTDALFGLRYRFDFTDRWKLLTRGDYSFGDTDGTLLLQANFAYTVGKKQHNQFLFGYQYKESKLKDGDLTTDMELSGPTVAFNFRF